MAKKVGTLIKEARTAAGLTQDALAKKISTLSASDISKAERGEKELTSEELKAIAKATGVTQKSLLDAAKGTAAKTASASTAKKTSSASKKTTSASKKTTSSGTSVKVTAAEKKLLELYREADSATKKAVMALLKGEGKTGSILTDLIGAGKDPEKIIGNLLENAMNMLGSKK